MNENIIAKNLRDIRGNKTQGEMAEILGVTTSAVTNYECGTRIPRDETKRAYAKFSGKTVDEIFFDQE